MTITGEERAWEMLAQREPADIASDTGAVYDPAGSSFRLACFGKDVLVSVQNRTIDSSSDLGRVLIKKFKFLSILAILHYLIHAENSPESGNLIKPSDLPGGDFFLFGTHVLPLDNLSEQFGSDIDAFIKKAVTLGGEILSFGDASVKLYPFPKFPIVLILWAGDDEFPAKASLLIDSTCCSHFPIDVIWSTAMMTLEIMHYTDLA
jgi:hypothetical protein